MLSKLIISDTSCFITLSNIGELNLLQLLFLDKIKETNFRISADLELHALIQANE